jgi:hypothetical protein
MTAKSRIHRGNQRCEGILDFRRTPRFFRRGPCQCWVANAFSKGDGELCNQFRIQLENQLGVNFDVGRHWAALNEPKKT